MRPLFEAIQARCEETSLAGLLTGGLHYDYAAQDAIAPYGVLVPFDTIDISTFDAAIYDVTVHIYLVSETADTVQIFQMQQACIDAFDCQTLHPSSRPDVIMTIERVTHPYRAGDDDRRYWQSIVEMRGIYQQSEIL